MGGVPLGTAQLLKPWDQTGHHHPHFLFTLMFERYLLLITKTFKNLVPQRYLTKNNVVYFTVEIEPWLVWLSGLGASLQSKGLPVVSSQGTRLGCRPGPQLGVHERQPHTDVSLPLFLPPFPSKNR